jgi:hypothetical protein
MRRWVVERIGDFLVTTDGVHFWVESGCRAYSKKLFSQEEASKLAAEWNKQANPPRKAPTVGT